jgi:hypothetical protein
MELIIKAEKLLAAVMFLYQIYVVPDGYEVLPKSSWNWNAAR